jgi:predicted Zn-dependent peptidase
LFTSGTQSRTAIDISDGFLALGARYGSSANYDGTFVSLQVLSNRLTPALELFADVVQNPSFPPAEVRRELPRRLNAIAQQRDNPSVVLGNLVAETLYGPAHAYGVSLLGTEATMKHARPDELRTFHRAQIRPDRATLVAAGDVSRQALLAALETTFAGWKGAAAKPRPLLEPAPRAGGGRIVLIDRPGATQSHVALADVGVPRKTPDYAALVVLNTILGGQFSSRLNLNLRETHAYTYGAGSAFDMRRGAGPFRTFGAILRESTGPAVTEMWRELERMRNEPVSAEELAAAQAYLVGRLPARFETAASTADALGALAVHDLPLDEYATYPARIARVTAADVQRAAQTYLRPERLRIVVLGDAASVRAPLEALKLGPVELRPES